MTVSTHIFPNGFRLIHEKVTNSSTSSINVFCDVGSIYEPINLKGVSHFIEHMCFKGTKKVPVPKDIFLTYDKVGAYLNAYTEKRYTCYTVKCDSDYLENIIEMISDMMLNSTFNITEFKKEEDVVIEENIKSEDTPVNLMHDQLTEMVYKGSSFENNVDKLIYHKHKFDYNEVVEFYKLFYKPHRMVFSITTSCSFNEIKRHLATTDYVKQVNNILEIPQKFMIKPCIQPQEDIRVKILERKGYRTSHIGISFRVESIDEYIINLFATIMSGPMSSRLFELLREKNGLTYTSSVSTNYHKVYGDITFYAETDKKKVLKNGSKPGVLSLLIGELNNLLKNGVTKKEVETAKQYKNGALKIASENIDTLTGHNGEKYLIHPDEDIVAFESLYDKCYKDISADDINTMIKKYIRPSLMSVSIVGPRITSENNIRDILRKIKSK
jgi:predicted Zn-dependent peptidase